jgi:hypothetical protein
VALQRLGRLGPRLMVAARTSSSLAGRRIGAIRIHPHGPWSRMVKVRLPLALVRLVVHEVGLMPSRHRGDKSRWECMSGM